MKNLEDLKEQIIKANEAYRLGESIMTDSQYDTLLDELCLCQYLSCSFDRLSEIYRTSTTLTFLHLLFESI